jgi:hypothetical protein
MKNTIVVLFQSAVNGKCEKLFYENKKNIINWIVISDVHL